MDTIVDDEELWTTIVEVITSSRSRRYLKKLIIFNNDILFLFRILKMIMMLNR